jgi:PAS domain S-box-containing protein
MLFVLAVGMFYCFNFEATFESQALLTTLNILFCTSASLFIVYLAARSYLVTGSRAVLCLGCGALCIAITYLLAGVLLTDLNAALIVHNAGVCLAGALFICSAYWAFMRKPGKTAPAKAPLYLGCIYFTVLLIIGFLTSGAMTGVIPAFNLPGQGFTLLRQAVLGVTVIEFILASMCFGILYRQSRTPFLLWYCLGLLLFGLGMGTLILEGNPGTPLSWVGRGGQYLGGLYMLIAILSLTETGGDWRMPLEKALHESEEKYRTIVETAGEGIWMSDIEGRTTFVNKRMAEMIGYTPDEMMGKSAYDFMDEGARALARINLERRKQGLRDHFEQKYVRKDGATLWAIVSSTPLLDKDGRVIAFMGMLTDITERKRIEAVIKQSEAQFRTLIQNLESGVALVDDSGRFAVVNPVFLMMFGLASELDILNVNSQDWGQWAVYGEDGSLLNVDDHPVRKAAMTGKPVKNRLVGVRNPGANGLTWMLISAEPVLKDDGSINMIVCTYHDITGRRQIEKEREQLLAQVQDRTSQLQQANEKLEIKSEEIAAQAEELQSRNEKLLTNNEELRAITESLGETRDYLDSLISYANAPIIVWDSGFTITRFNGAFERLSGRTTSEVIGKDLGILFPDERRREAFDKIRLTLAGEFWESVEIPIQHKDGSIRIALWNSANIYGNDKKLLATIAQGQDITERKRVEGELSEAKAQAELYLDLMGHDISNMHQIILMQLEMAEDILGTRGTLELEDKELIDVSVKTLEKATKLVDNVRKLQKLKSGEYGREAVDQAKVLEDTLKVYANIPGRDVTIKYTPSYGNLVQANPLLKDVFSNLVDNAVKHSSGPLELGIDVSKIGRNGSSYYRVAIEDNGNGIHDNKKDEVFERFKRGQTKAKGTGLGLYLVKSLVEGFGGYVEVQNRVIGDYRKGTRFLVYLPVMSEKNA